MNFSLKLLQFKFVLYKIYVSIMDRLAPSVSGRFCAQLFLTPIRIPTRPFVLEHETETISIEDIRVCVRIFGNPKGKRVLLVHGWSSQGTIFRTMIQSLITAGYEIYVPDMPGHGDSSEGKSSVFRFTEAVTSIQNNYGPFHAIIGHSLGGIASMLSISENKQFAPQKLVTICTPVHFDHIADVFLRRLGASARTKFKMVEHLTGVFGEVPYKASGTNLVQQLPKSIDLLHVYDQSDEEVTEEDSLEMAYAAKSEIISTQGLGHNRPLKDKTVLNGVLSFIQNY